jgi:hypothetical protein
VVLTHIHGNIAIILKIYEAHYLTLTAGPNLTI